MRPQRQLPLCSLLFAVWFIHGILWSSVKTEEKVYCWKMEKMKSDEIRRTIDCTEIYFPMVFICGTQWGTMILGAFEKRCYGRKILGMGLGGCSTLRGWLDWPDGQDEARSEGFLYLAYLIKHHFLAILETFQFNWSRLWYLNHISMLPWYISKTRILTSFYGSFNCTTTGPRVSHLSCYLNNTLSSCSVVSLSVLCTFFWYLENVLSSLRFLNA